MPFRPRRVVEYGACELGAAEALCLGDSGRVTEYGACELGGESPPSSESEY